MKPLFPVFFCVSLVLAGCGKPEDVEQTAAEEPAPGALSEKTNLSADDLASALGVTWVETELRGSDKNSYVVGAVLEFGDGRKSEFTGNIGPIPGGTKVKVFSRQNGDRLDVTIVANGSTGRWFGGLQDPFEGTLLTNSGRVIDIDDFLMKGSVVSGDYGVNSEVSLLETEAWLRVVYKKRPVTVSSN